MTGGCDDKDKIEEEIPEVSPESPDKFVYVIFPVNALGDHAYNDLVLAGILEAQKKAGFYTMLYAPIDMEEGILMLNLALDGINSAKKGECLAIIAGNEYEEATRQWLQGKKLRDGFGDDVLLFETNGTDLPLSLIHI